MEWAKWFFLLICGLGFIQTSGYSSMTLGDLQKTRVPPVLLENHAQDMRTALQGMAADLVDHTTTQNGTDAQDSESAAEIPQYPRALPDFLWLHPDPTQTSA